MNSKDKNEQARGSEMEKEKAHIIVEIIEYIPHAVVSRTIIKKSTGNITVSSFAAGEELAQKSSAFDTYIQIIDGKADIIIDGKTHKLKLGQGIIIPAHKSNSISAEEQFKMISTVIKAGMNDKQEMTLSNTARALMAAGKGLIAMDESTVTCNKRFALYDIAQTEEKRRV